MMGPYAWLNRVEGSVECMVRGCLPEKFLNYCAAADIPVLAAENLDADMLRVTLRLRDAERAAHLALRAQCELTQICRRGGRMIGQTLLRRFVPVLCLFIFLCLLTWSKLYIWEISVSGNEQVSTARILNALQECGVGPGSFWPRHTSDNLRSELLVKLPELAWATVNIHGSRAEVIVRERVPKPELFDDDICVDLVAERVGFVTAVQALNGTAKVKPGSAVMPGEVLVAGEADSAFAGQRRLHAVGTVQAETYYELTAAVPVEQVVRSDTGRTHSRWALEIGRQRINFYRNSSKCDAACDKIKKEWQCKAEGLFALPLTLVRESCSESILCVQQRDKTLCAENWNSSCMHSCWNYWQAKEKSLRKAIAAVKKTEPYRCASVRNAVRRLPWSE